MKCLGPAWSILPLLLVSCSSPAQVCPAPQLFVDGACVDLCEELACDDDNECTFEECEVNVQTLTARCVETHAENGRACESTDGPGACMMGQCDSEAMACVPVGCNDGNDCTVDGTCNTEKGECEGGENAEEGTPCDGTGICDGAGRCLECSLPQHCNDENQCTQDSCVERLCEHENLEGHPCDYMGGTENGVCDEQGRCGAPPPNCAPNPCVDTGKDCTLQLCDAEDGSCSTVNLDGACADAPGGFPGTCEEGECIGLCEEPCPAGPECLMDATCNPQNGVCEPGAPKPTNTPCSEGGGQRCDGAGDCVECTDTAQCDDDNECTTDSCDTGSGACGHEPRNGASCTSFDDLPGFCLGSTCNPGPPKVIGIHPEDGATMPRCFDMTAYFDRPLDPATVNDTTIRLNVSTTNIDLRIFYNPNNNSVIFTPFDCLPKSALHAISIRLVKDLSGREMTIGFTSNFGTNDFSCSDCIP